MKFEELDLSYNILDALYDMKFEECTPIQEKTIPHILNGEDVLGIAQTGTGKTAAYLLPVLSLIDDYPNDFPSDAINCVIMSPTRELAQQIDQAMQGFGYYLDGISSIPVYGGNDGNRFDQEVKAMKEGAGLLIATPGRLISHLQIGNLDLSRCSFFILDEADRMLDMGFSEDIMKIAKELPPTCQTIMFSATMPEKIEELAKTILKNPVEVKIAVSKPAEKIQQAAYVCYEPQKLRIIESIFRQGDLQRVIIFSGKKTKVKDIATKLTRMKINCGAMHSDLTQAERDDIMFRFKAGQIDVLVATDIVSRGIDIDDILMVINYDVPHDAEDYVHRIGRTARAQRDGRAITLVSEGDIYYFQMIEKFLEREVTKLPMPDGLDNGPEYKTAKKDFSRQRQGGKRNARPSQRTKTNKAKPHREASPKKKQSRPRRKPANKGNEEKPQG
ncbi:DEAD/DEAH box helicase [Prevotella sp. PINT]|jgi:Superfamily II DNA and RNA helicases|nr:DEAD/DEAH box helicase [Palleniella intestinalis]NPD81483.1 DEAD/DEAH box helicase [Palleniella intestinalis]